MTDKKCNKNIILFTVLLTFFITSALSSLLAMFVHNFYINNIFADVRAIFDGTIPWIEQRISAQFFVDEMRLASANVWCIVFAVAFAIAALPCIILLVKNILICVIPERIITFLKGRIPPFPPGPVWRPEEIAYTGWRRNVNFII